MTQGICLINKWEFISYKVLPLTCNNWNDKVWENTICLLTCNTVLYLVLKTSHVHVKKGFTVSIVMWFCICYRTIWLMLVVHLLSVSYISCSAARIYAYQLTRRLKTDTSAVSKKIGNYCSLCQQIYYRISRCLVWFYAEPFYQG